MKRICVLPGDGIGPEVTSQAVRVLEALPTPLEFVYGEVGYGAFEASGTPLPDATIEKVQAASATLLGAVTTPPNEPTYMSPVIELRQRFGLFANVRPCRSIPHARSRQGIDLVIVRENTEGMYAQRERVEDQGDTVVAERVITRRASDRIIRYAYNLARRASLPKVTIVHKANVLRESCGLFRRVGMSIAEEYPDVETEEMFVDTCAMNLVRQPERFGVIVTTNLFGDILSDEASMLVGGLGLAPSANVGDELAVCEPVHGSAPDIAGQGVANPIAAILSASLMLQHLGFCQEAEAVRKAVRTTLEGGLVTPDLGGTLNTEGVANAVIRELDTSVLASIRSRA